MRTLQAEWASRGRRVVGRKADLKTSVTSSPASRKERFGRSPTFSALTRQAWLQAAKRLRAFRAAYRSAYEAWRSGEPDVEFPAGTWWLARCANATIAT